MRLRQQWSGYIMLLATLGKEGEELFELKVGPRLFTIISAWKQHYE